MSQEQQPQQRPLSLRQIEELAQLALIPLSPQEAQRLERELSSIIDAVACLRALPLPQEGEGSDVAGVENVLRPDEPRELDPRMSHKLVAAAARHSDGYVVVKQVLPYDTAHS